MRSRAGQSSSSSPFDSFETLEARRLFSISLDLGVLSIIGTKKADTITLGVEASTPDQLTVRMDGLVRRFARVDIGSIYIQAGQGDDFLQIDPGKKQLTQAPQIYGSGGNDTLIGGYGKDRIYGGSGDDRIEGNSARDVLYGEAGNDTIIGGQANDVIHGNQGNDSLVGSQGYDQIFGEEDDDTIDSVDGNVDYVNGGPNTDKARTDKLDETLVSIEKILNPRT